MDKPSFTDVLDDFLLLSEKILQHDSNGELRLVQTQSNAIQAALLGYKNIYNKTRTSTKHVDKFSEIYSKCRFNLVNTSTEDFMNWFLDTSFVIAPLEKSRNKIYVSVIFRNSTKIAEDISNRSDTKPELLNTPAALYPEYFSLYLLRLFTFCCDETDKKTLSSHIEELEVRLGLKKDQSADIGDSVSSIFNVAKDMVKDFGVEVPDNIPTIQSHQFKDILNHFSKDEATKDMIKSVLKDVNMNNTSEIPTVIGNLLSKMQQTASEVPPAIAEANAATS